MIGHYVALPEMTHPLTHLWTFRLFLTLSQFSINCIVLLELFSSGNISKIKLNASFSIFLPIFIFFYKYSKVWVTDLFLSQFLGSVYINTIIHGQKGEENPVKLTSPPRKLPLWTSFWFSVLQWKMPKHFLSEERQTKARTLNNLLHCPSKEELQVET